MIAFHLPPIIGLGTGSGFEYQLKDPRGREIEDLAAVSRGLLVSGSRDPALANLFTTVTERTPQIYLDIDRDKVQTLGVDVASVLRALQVLLGGYYVNDFNRFGRTWPVTVQGAMEDRNEFDDIYRIHVRSRDGSLVPLGAVAEAKIVLSPEFVMRYNNARSIAVNGSPAPGYAFGDALDAMERLSAETLPDGYDFEWTALAFQEKRAAGETGPILIVALVCVYLVLVSLYESWMLPVVVM